MNKPHLTRLTALLLGITANLTPSTQAQGIISDFSTFPGSAGAGWTNGWSLTKAAPNTAFDASNAVVASSTDTPLTPAGNAYATFSQSQSSGSTKLVAASLSRSYTSYGDVIATAPHTLSFSLRLDSGAVNFTNSSSALSLYGYATTPNSATPFRVQNTWYIRLNNDTKAWEFYNGQQDNTYDVGNWIGSDITAALGEVYNFSLILNPEDGTWRASISNGTTTWTSEQLGYQSDKLYGSSINFAATLGSGDSIDFSLGEVQVIPEPTGTASILIGASLLQGVRLYRRRRK